MGRQVVGLCSVILVSTDCLAPNPTKQERPQRATTPSLKQYLADMIAQSERLAEEVVECIGNGAVEMQRSARLR